MSRCRKILLLLLCFSPLTSLAQFNVDRLIMSGRSSLYYEDYVLSIQYFSRAISYKPYLYEAWYYRAIAKFYLDDFIGAENDCSEAIALNPYIAGIYELRGLCRIRQRHFEEAIGDYDKALLYQPSGQNLWFNRALCRVELKDYQHAHEELDSMIQRWGRLLAGVFRQGRNVYAGERHDCGSHVVGQKPESRSL